MNKPDYESLYKELFHEVRSITAGLIGRAAELSKSLEKNPDIPRAITEAEAVAELAFQLQNWLQLSELESGSAGYSPSFRIPRSLHGIFFRAGKMMRPSLRANRLKWSLNTDCKEKDTFMVPGYPILDTLPYILLDNAIKYSVKDSTIACFIGRVENRIFISMTSKGPKLADGESEHVIKPGYRGVNARIMNPCGSGRGLALAAMICRLHGAKLDVKCIPEAYSIGGVDFGKFVVELVFQRE